MEVMPAEPFRLQQSVGFRGAIHKNPAEWPGRGPETRSHSGRGDAAEGPANQFVRASQVPSASAYLFSGGWGRKHLVEIVPDHGVAFASNLFERCAIDDVDETAAVANEA